MNKLTTQEFIEKSQKIHGNKYDYSKSIYINAKSLILIICPIHGEFKQHAMSHMKGCGCQACSKVHVYSTDEFISKCREIHNNKYDYYLVKYSGILSKIDIICPIHGLFKQEAKAHKDGQGCPKCANKNVTLDEFINKAKNIHGDKYDYTLVKYENSVKKINIICYKHGVFKQTPNSHIFGIGCPHCSESKGEKEIAKILDKYLLNYERQKTFNECINKRKLPFDFYLPKFNLCIEYDDEQHFKPIKFFGGEDGLKYRQNNDAIKDEYCNKNNINLLRIKYNDNIQKILEAHIESYLDYK